MKLNILLIGSGGREHALAKSLLASPSTGSLTCSPGNAGIALDCLCVPLPTHEHILAFCKAESIDLVVVGPEQPLVDGLADKLRASGIAVFGPGALGAQLEGSKDFTKKLCDRHNIPTAAYATFDSEASALSYLAVKEAPIVIKADGLAAGKGVTVAMTHAQAESAVRECFSGSFGAAGSRVVIEEYMEGPEVSFFALTDGKRTIPFCAAQDHKRVGEGDTGPNTGGMGTYSPAPIFTADMQARVMREIIEPTVAGLAKDGIPYVGVLFAGLMLTPKGPKLIEYNCRFGDPETQVMLARFNGDLAKLLHSCARGQIDPTALSFADTHALCVVMASKGYPGDYAKNTPISGLELASAIPNTLVYHAGTTRDAGGWKSNGGRVLGVTGLGETLKIAQTRAYKAIDTIDWPEGFCRTDIGWRAL